jgi:hypothetical protein
MRTPPPASRQGQLEWESVDPDALTALVSDADLSTSQIAERLRDRNGTVGSVAKGETKEPCRLGRQGH